MPKVSINIIKDWFRNQQKPPQEQFWAWLDSFWHKDEPIPQDGVERLPETLQAKADLVNGVVPDHQLPFSIKTSEVLAIGVIAATETTVTIAVHSSGKNRVRVGGVVYERAFPNSFTYTKVENYTKILIVYAMADPAIFFLAEGSEALEAVEPELPAGALIVRRIVVNTLGQVIEPELEGGLKYNEEDGWRNINLTDPLTILSYSYDLRSAYWITSTVADPVIGGIRNALIDRNASPSWDGKEFWIYNATGGDLLLDSATVTDEDVFLFVRPITLKSDQSCKVKLRRDALEIVGVMSGGASFPEGGNPGDVLQYDEDGAAWTDRLTNAEDAIDAEVVNRAVADAALQTQVTAEQNKTASVADKFLHYWDTSLGRWFSSGLKFVAGVVNQLEFAGRIKADAIVLPANSNAVVPNRLRSDGEDVFFSNLSGVEKRLIKTPSLSGDFITYSDILALDASGNPARVAAGSIDFPSLLFVSNAKWMMPNANAATYSVFRSAAPVVVGGSTNGVQPKPAVNYNSNGATISFQRGNPLLNNGALRWRHIRNFDINTAIASQRVFVGISDNYLTAAPTNVPISTSLGYGIAMIEGSSNIHFVGDVIVDSGIVNSTTKEYILDITGIGTTVKITITAISSGGSVNSSYTFVGTQRKCPVIWCIDALESTAVRVRDYGAYDEQKYY